MRKRALLFGLWVFLLVEVFALAEISKIFDLDPLPPRWQYGNVTIDRLSTAAGQRPVAFYHWSHRMRYTCRVCHFELGFAMKANVTEITEEQNRAGEYCGACHNGEIAFGHSEENCAECHGRDLAGSRRKFKKAVANFPETSYGNEVDWSEAMRRGLIDPKKSLYDDRFEPIEFTRPVVLEAAWSMVPPADFSHQEHVRWLDCADCHPDVFNVKKKTTEHFAMKYILEEKFCGVCHLRVAFPLQDCKRCHSKMRH
ncbi:MAG: hypothetical protein GY856_10200 [bacterium]|nr:hypothetical protein [bacterium]